MDPVIAVIIVIAVVVITAAVLLVLRRRRRNHLRERFGPEYDRTLERADSTRAAERDLSEREEFHDNLELRELSDRSAAATGRNGMRSRLRSSIARRAPSATPTT